MQRSSYGLIAVVIVFVAALGLREWSVLPDGRTHLYFMDVGQGDGAVIVTPSGKRVIVDGGPDLRLLERLGTYLSFFNRRIDLLVLSHPNLDHLASFPEILKRYDVRSVAITGIAYDLPRYTQMLRLIEQQHVPIISPQRTGTVDLGDGVTLRLLWPTTQAMKQGWSDANDSSIVLRVSDGEHSALFTGDMEELAERQMLQAGIDVDADILKVAHHGSRSSSSTGFLLAVSPSLAVISVGKDNSYGHPVPEILRRFSDLHIPVRRTDVEGTVEIIWP